MRFLKFNKPFFIVLLILSIVGYYVVCYQINRVQFLTLTMVYFGLFLAFYLVLKKHHVSFKSLVFLSVLFRVILLFVMPNLSQDFYRFIWDGRMLLNGFNPYLFTPESFINSNVFPVHQAQELYAGMGDLNGSHYSNYPPINQLCFLIAALFGSKSILGSVIVLRSSIILADIGVIYFGKKLLSALNIPVKNIFWYALNPFIIIELTGNLHFEAVMLFFLIWSLHLLYNKKWVLAAMVFALSVSTKLIPLLFLPLFFGWFFRIKRIENEKISINIRTKFFKLIGFYSIVLICCLLTFLPFFNSEFITNYSQTIGLWFSNFEFNASFYYVFRTIGYWVTGYNQIAVIGKLMPVIVIAVICFLSFFKKQHTFINLMQCLLIAFTVYLFFSTTVHPWYIATLVVLSVFTKYNYPLVWSLLIVLSYHAYSSSNFNENTWVIAFQYFIVISVFILELVFAKKLKHH